MLKSRALLSDCRSPRSKRSACRYRWRTSIAVVLSVLLSVAAMAVELEPEGSFPAQLKRVDQALKTNPNEVGRVIIESCLERREYALTLYNDAQERRALRNLMYCFDALGIPRRAPRVEPEVTKIEEKLAAAALELEQALALSPDPTRGEAVYAECALCHEPEGFGLPGGSVPQIAGQHRTVLIKQLADMRAGNRDAVPMLPYATVEAIGGPQAVADVTGYIESLKISTAGGKGDGSDLAHGELVYADACARCHGERGEGMAETYAPRIQSQHYQYMLRQFEWIRSGKRRNSDAEMQLEIQTLSERDVRAALDYVSRLTPPEELQAPPG